MQRIGVFEAPSPMQRAWTSSKSVCVCVCVCVRYLLHARLTKSPKVYAETTQVFGSAACRIQRYSSKFQERGNFKDIATSNLSDAATWNLSGETSECEVDVDGRQPGRSVTWPMAVLWAGAIKPLSAPSKTLVEGSHRRTPLSGPSQQLQLPK